MASTRRHVVASALALALAVELAGAPAFAHEGETLAPTPAATPPPPPTSPVGAVEARNTPWPWVLIGVGALTLGTGIWLVHKNDTDAEMPACTTSPFGRTSCPYATQTFWQGWAVVAIGAQLAIAGAAWRVYEVRHHAKKSVSVVAGLGSLGLSGTF
jgi:hypothetical protein